MTDASGSTSRAYDAQGRLVQNNRVIQGEGYALAYGYDDNREVTSITLPSGHIITYARDDDGLVTGVTAQESGAGPVIPIVSNVAYEPFGPLKQLTYGSGLGMLRTYDQNYWLAGLEVSSLINTTLDLSFSRNENGGLDGVTDNASTGRDAGYGYTDSSRLQYAVGPWGNDSFSYDAAGNRVEVRTDTGGTATYEFAVMSPTSNQVTEVRDTSWNLLRDLTYRDGGDLEVQSYSGGSDFDYGYNARKRLTQVTENGTVTAAYSYDYRSRRVARSLPGSGTSLHYIIDDEGRLLAEHDGSTGAMLREYIWIDDMPVALVVDNGGTLELYFIHVGQIGEPLAVTDFYQNTVWAAAVDPWGRATMLISPLGDLDLRLQGQWLQLETGLHQNWMRDYDPSLGRYVEVDPLGLEAGQNPYAYVDGDPLNAADPTGLFSLDPRQWVRSIRSTYDQFARWRLVGHRNFPGEEGNNSYYRHCTINCVTGNQKGVWVSRFYGIGNEIQGLFRHDIPRLPSRIRGETRWAFQWSDIRHNEVGLRYALCPPRGLPDDRLFEWCERLCKRGP